MFGGSGEMVVKTVGFLQVGKFDALPPGNFATVPKARGKHLIATGIATAFNDAVPEGARMARYSEADFTWNPNAKPAPDVVLQIADIRQKFNWTQEQLQSAFLLGFPKADRTVLRSMPGGGSEQVPQWSERPIDEWRKRFLALNVR